MQYLASRLPAGVLGAAAVTTTRAAIVAVRRAGKRLNMLIRSTVRGVVQFKRNSDQMWGENSENAGLEYESCLYMLFYNVPCTLLHMWLCADIAWC